MSELLAVTVDDLLATLQGWARAIQARDGLSHMFRAKVVVGADSLRTLIGGVGGEGRGKPSAPKRASGGGAAPAAPATAPSGAPKPARNPTPNSVLPSVKLPPLPNVKLPPLTTLPKTTDKPGEDGSALLDFLLGP